MSDRELLEKAAMAAGYEFRLSPDWHDAGSPQIKCNRNNWLDWSPLTDDGDALRLAVKLQIQVTPRTDGKSEAAHTAYFIEPNGSYQYAATRRAIVRAAAAIHDAKGQHDQN